MRAIIGANTLAMVKVKNNMAQTMSKQNKNIYGRRQFEPCPLEVARCVEVGTGTFFISRSLSSSLAFCLHFDAPSAARCVVGGTGTFFISRSLSSSLAFLFAF